MNFAKMNPSPMMTEAGRVLRFTLVGILATVVYAASSIGAIILLGMPPLPASIFGQLAATGISYFGHSVFSFRVGVDHRAYLQKFLAIAAVTFLLNGLVTWFLTDFAKAPYGLSITIVTVLIPVVNYVCNRLWVFLPGLGSTPSKSTG